MKTERLKEGVFWAAKHGRMIAVDVTSGGHVFWVIRQWNKDGTSTLLSKGHIEPNWKRKRKHEKHP